MKRRRRRDAMRPRQALQSRQQRTVRTLGAVGLALLALAGGGIAHSQGGAPVIQVLESGQPLADGSWFNRAVTPVVQTSGGQAPVTVNALLDGAPFTSGTVVSAPGAHQLAVTAADAAGAPASPVAVGFTIKTTPPVFGPLAPAPGTITAATQVTVTGTVDGAVAVTVAGLAATVVGGQSFSAGPVPLVEGGNNLALSARDAAGNVGTATLSLVRDTTAPRVAISAPAQGAVVGTPAVDVVGSVSDPHLASVTVNGTAASVTGGLFRAAQVPLAEGGNTVTVLAVDQAGNQSQATAAVVRDTQPPTLQITSPASGTVVPGDSVTVSGVASDPHLDRVLVGGAPAALVATSGGAAASWSLAAPLVAGSNTITVQAIDVVGNSAAASVTVVRDSSAPQVHIDQPADGARLNATAVDVSGTVQQKNGMVVTVNGAAAAIGADGASFSLAGVALVEGQNRLVARATDPAGDQGVHAILVVRDTVAPTLAAADPASGAQGIPLGTAFRLTFSEAMAAPAAGSWALRTAAGAALAATATLSGSTLTVQPTAALPPAAALQLVLGAGLTDLAGNALAPPQTLSFTTLDSSAPAAPVVGAVPAYLCAASVTLAGTAAAGSIVDAAGGAAAAETRADASSGQFTLAVLLTPGAVNRLLVTATSPSTGAVSAPATVQVVQDCQAPYVTAAQAAGGKVTIGFDKPIKPATIVAAAGAGGAVTVTGAAGPVSGAVTLSADGRTATFTPAPPGTPLPGGVLRLDVSTAVADLAGNALAYPYTQLFGTGTAAGTSFLAGTAIDNGVGRPLQGAQVLVALENGAAPPAPAPEQVTGGDGSFSVAVPAGTHQLWITRQGYTPVYRVVTVGDAQGASVFAPRLTPAAAAQSVGPAGGTVVGTPPGGAAAAGGSGTGGVAAAPSLAIPGGALGAPAAVSLTGLDEQGLPAPLPFGWSPRGAAWLDLGGAALSGTAVLTLPVEAPAGAPLVVVRLDPATLQWRVVAAGVPVAGGAVTASLSGSGAGGGYAAVDPDTAAEAPSPPPAAVAGAVLPAATAPAGTEVSAATLTFNPATVLPAQTSLATALYSVAAGGVASGMPLTLSVAEQLTLLDGTTRKQPPYPADLVLYHAGDGTARSRFRLAPSAQAQELPLSLGSEAVGLRLYAGGAAQGDVVGPAGGTFTSGDGDRVDLPPGALAQATAVGLARVAAADLPLPAPAGTQLAGALRLDLAGEPLLAPATLTLALPAAPAPGDQGLLLEATDFGTGPVLRPVAALQAAGSAWTTAPIVAADLPWPGVLEGGVYLFVRLTAATGYLHGTVTGPGAGGGPAGPVLAAQVTAAGLGWTQATAADGSYVLPVPAGAAAVAVAALDPATGNSAAAAATVPAGGARVGLDLVLQAVPLAVSATVPADGATAVLPGIQPSLTFNRPVDPATVIPAANAPGGVQLLQGTQLVPADVTVQGATVNLVPRASLQPGTVYRIQATTAVHDLYGNALAAAFSASFTTQTMVLPSSFNLDRVFLVEPDGSGMAAVIGQPGALPAGALVFVENLTALISTPSGTVAQDGSFRLSVQAALTDTLRLHVLVTGQNEVQAPLGPFHSADLASALVDAGGAVFSTGAGVKVSVPAGAFAALTRVRLTPAAPAAPPAAPVEDGFNTISAFALDFTDHADGSAIASTAKGKGLGLVTPAPAGADPNGVYLVFREVTPFGRPAWMLMDLMSLDAAHGDLTTQDGACGGPEAARSRAAAAPSDGTVRPLLNRDQALPAKDYVSQIVFPGHYQVQQTLIPLGYYIFPAGWNTDIVIVDSSLTAIASVADAAITALLVVPELLVPVRLDRPATITVLDLSTGYQLYSHTFDPPASSAPVVVPPEVLADHKPPLPVTGSPVRFFLLDLASRPGSDLDTGITFQTTGSSLNVTGQAGAAQAQAAVVLVGVDDGKTANATADASGAFQLQITFTPQKRYVLAIGATVATNEPLLVSFTKGLDPSWQGLDVRDALGNSVAPEIVAAGSQAAVSISPAAGWAAGQTYTLHLGHELSDPFGDTLGHDVDVAFRVESSDVLNTYTLSTVRDVARMGSELFVAGGTAGLVVLDASNPAHLVNVVPGNITFPFPLNDPVHGVAVEAHGRVLVVGGGITGFGQLKIFDPLRLDPAAVAANPNDPAVRYAAFRGSTSIADVPDLQTGTGTGAKEGPGTPKWVASYSNDLKVDWVAGAPLPEDAPPGLILTPPGASPTPPDTGEYILAVAGSRMPPNHPISLFDRTLGRFTRTDAAADGTFSLALSVRNGDRIELLLNADSFAYVATPPIGVEAVDLNVVYNHPPVGPGDNSGLMGWYDGLDDPKLQLCGAPVGGIGETVNGVATLFDAGNPHPLVVATLLGNNGVLLLEAPMSFPSGLTYLSDICTDFQDDRQITGMVVVQRYVFDYSAEGGAGSNQPRDYIVASHRLAGVLIYDVTDRAQPRLVGQIPMPGEAAHLGVDTEKRLLYVAGYGGGVYVVDFNRAPAIGLLDKNHDGIDDRVLESIKLPGNTDAPVFLVPDLGLAYAGGLSRGVTSIAVGGPRLTALANNLDTPDGGQAGGTREIAAVAPFGVPSVEEEGNGQRRPGLIQFLASLPGGLGPQVTLGLLSVGWTGAPVPAAAGDCAPIPNLPPVKLDDLTFTRQSNQLYQEGYNLFLSQPLAVLADLKASHFYHRSADEDDHCTRCDLSAEQVPDGAREILSGDTLKLSFPAALRAQLDGTYSSDQLDSSELALPSVRWELTPSPHQEPAQNAPAGVQLHSGEMTASGTDMTIAGRGMDFVFERAYRSQTLGDGPFGPGWDHNFNQRLRELPNGDVEHYDGRGRREVFHQCQPEEQDCPPQGQEGQDYVSPVGVFSTLQRTTDGFQVIDARHDLTLFDRGGRLLSIADAVKQDDSTGNQMTMHYGAGGRLERITETLGRDVNLTYDSHGHITQIEDFDGRDWTYQYDGSCRLVSVTTPTVLTVLFAGGDDVTTSSDGIATTYAYDSTTGDLATTLGARGKMTSVTDGKGQSWLQVSYADQRGSGRNEEVGGQTFGGGQVTYDYDFQAHTATATDALQNQVQFSTTAAGQISQITDPIGATAAYTYDEEGLVTSKTDPLGRVTAYSYDSPCIGDAIGKRRSRGNLTRATVVPDSRGPNGSTGSLVTCTDYEGYSNQAVKIVDPRGSATQIARNEVGLPIAVTRAAGAPEQSVTQTSYNDYGQPQQVINPNGHVTQYLYSSIGYLQQETVVAGALSLRTGYETDDRGNVTAMTDPRGVRHQRTYNALNWITSSTRAASASVEVPPAPALRYVTSYLYDPNGNLVEEQRPIGDGTAATRVRHIYGPLDEVLVQAREIQPGDHWTDWSKTTYSYDLNRNLVQTIEPDGQTTVISYDKRNLPVARTRGFGSPAAVAEAFQYDQERHLALYADGRQNHWLTRYDGYGRVAATVDPLGNHADTLYDSGGNPVAAMAFQLQGSPPSDQLLAQRNAAYDLLGRRTALTAKLWTYDLQNLGLPQGARDLTTAVQYDPASNVTAVTDPLLRTTRYVYDAAERRIATVDAAGNRLEHDLDADGNAVTTRSIEQLTGGTAGGGGPVTVTTHATYDALDRLATTVDGLGNSRAFSYDARNNLAFSVDAEGNLTTQGWDGLDRLVQTVKPEGVEVDYAYDKSSRLAGYADALRNQTSYAYDALDRRVSVTYPDHTTETTSYDADGNPQQVVDANGSRITQQYDAANRMTSRSVSPASGVAGALAETYVYDGLRRLTHAQSGNQSTDLAFDSLSRRVREVVGGKTVTYGFDDAGNETAIGYPSGYGAARTFDPLDRLLSVGQANGPSQSTLVASFGFRGPDLVASQSRANGVATVRQFDAAKRMLDDWWQIGVQTPNPETVFRQGLSWSPRGLKSAEARADLGGAGLLFAYDRAERLAEAAKSPAPQAAAANDVALKPADLAAMPDAFGYTYDAAQNLLARSVATNGVAAATALPLDGSGRNRPGALGSVALQWDRNGNLVQKGNLAFHYDFRNRLVQVTDAANPGTEIAHYEYDAFNRRITKTVGTASRQTVWQGWRPIEDYDTSGAPRLLARRTYGSGLDDILYLESDLDGSGNVAAKSWPLYDASGNLALLTNAAGKPLERYEYTPYGAQKTLVDSTPPAVQQVRVVGGAVWVELSEAVVAAPLAQAVTANAVTLFDITTQASFTGIAAAQPVLTGDLAGRRLVITAAGPAAHLAVGDQVTLTIPAAALVDSFLNQPAQDYTVSFPWPAADAVVADLAAPVIQRVTLRQGTLEVEVSSEPNQTAAAAAIQLDGAPLAWTLAADHYTLTSTTQVPPGAHTLTVATSLTDLGGRALAAPLSQSFTAAQQDTQALYTAPDPHQVSASTVGNLFGFQGLPRDPETGLIYFRNRYYDPELGRFITADPKEYTDGPSMYAFEMDDPVNGSDPMGLCLGFGEGTCADFADKAAAKLHEFKSKISADDSGVLGIVANTIAGTTVDAVETFLVDPLRAGQATGNAIGSGAGAGDIALSVVQDVGRVAALAAGAGTAVKAVSKGVGAAAKGVKAAAKALDTAAAKGLEELAEPIHFGPEVNESLQDTVRGGEKTAKELKRLRDAGVRAARREERELLRSGHPDTADAGGWTPQERQAIMQNGSYPEDVRWHHINDVEHHPELADVPDNIIPSRGGPKGHTSKYHPRGTRRGSTGTVVNRYVPPLGE
jgi:RHS repeat-associated protein